MIIIFYLDHLILIWFGTTFLHKTKTVLADGLSLITHLSQLIFTDIFNIATFSMNELKMNFTSFMNSRNKIILKMERKQVTNCWHHNSRTHVKLVIGGECVGYDKCAVSSPTYQYKNKEKMCE